MNSLIQANQQLVILEALLFVLVLVFWILQQWIIRYGRQLINRFVRYGGTVKQYSSKSTVINQLRDNHPHFFDFLSKRLQSQHFTGLPLTLILLAIGYFFALFVGLVEDVVTSDTIVGIDHYVSSQMARLQEPSLVNFFAFMTSFGSGFIPYLVTILACLLCVIMRKPYIVLGLLISTIGGSTFTAISKQLFHRTRPQDALLLESSFSFPSGHATIAMALYGFLGYLMIRFSSNFTKQVQLFFLTLFFCFLIGLSRIVLNVHYLSDVMGGFLVGILWLLIGVSMTEWLTAKEKITWQLLDSPVLKYTASFVVILVLIGTLFYTQFYQLP